MSGFTAVDLSQLPPPDVVEQFTFEQILAQMVEDLQMRDPAFTAIVESDPAMKILEVCAYRETLVRQRTNEASRAVMLAYARGTDLDHIAANYVLQRLVLDPGDPTALPPILPTYESDTAFRRRIQLSPEGYTTAGSRGSYVFHALSASALVKDAQAVSPNPGMVTVYVLSQDGDGEASVDLIDAVAAALNADTVRPMTDLVTVQSVSVMQYRVDAELTVFAGPDAEVIRQTAYAAAAAYAEEQHRVGRDITRSGLFAALHQRGVQNVKLIEPAGDMIVGDGEAAFCTEIAVIVVGVDE